MSNRSTLLTAARGIISGEISNGATWIEDIEITEDGTAISGTPASWTWTLTLREESETPAILTLSTTDSTLSISQGTDATTLQIRCPQSSLTNLRDDYIIDIRSQDTSDVTVEPSGKLVHWAHGSATVLNEPPV